MSQSPYGPGTDPNAPGPEDVPYQNPEQAGQPAAGGSYDDLPSQTSDAPYGTVEQSAPTYGSVEQPPGSYTEVEQQPPSYGTVQEQPPNYETVQSQPPTYDTSQSQQPSYETAGQAVTGDTVEQPVPTFDTGGMSTGSDQSKTDVAKQEASAVKDTAKEAGANVAETAKQEAANVVSEARSQARSLMGTVSDEVRSQSSNQQQRLAQAVHSLAKELGGMASSSNESGPLTDLAHQAARRGGEIAHWLENREPADVLEELRAFARRRPVVFLGLCALAGVVAGRLTRSAVAANTSLDSPSDGSRSLTSGDGYSYSYSSSPRRADGLVEPDSTDYTPSAYAATPQAGGYSSGVADGGYAGDYGEGAPGAGSAAGFGEEVTETPYRATADYATDVPPSGYGQEGGSESYEAREENR